MSLQQVLIGTEFIKFLQPHFDIMILGGLITIMMILLRPVSSDYPMWMRIIWNIFSTLACFSVIIPALTFQTFTILDMGITFGIMFLFMVWIYLIVTSHLSSDEVRKFG
jgi:hypothetical protein